MDKLDALAILKNSSLIKQKEELEEFKKESKSYGLDFGGHFQMFYDQYDRYGQINYQTNRVQTLIDDLSTIHFRTDWRFTNKLDESSLRLFIAFSLFELGNKNEFSNILYSSYPECYNLIYKKRNGITNNNNINFDYLFRPDGLNLYDFFEKFLKLNCYHHLNNQIITLRNRITSVAARNSHSYIDNGEERTINYNIEKIKLIAHSIINLSTIPINRIINIDKNLAWSYNKKNFKSHGINYYLLIEKFYANFLNDRHEVFFVQKFIDNFTPNYYHYAHNDYEPHSLSSVNVNYNKRLRTGLSWLDRNPPQIKLKKDILTDLPKDLFGNGKGIKKY